jgi:predicted DNA-binding transcriptional regulator AlpA
MKELLTTREAAEYIGYGAQALSTSRMEGGTIGGISPPKHVKVGTKTVRYRKSDLDEWIKSLGE